MSKLTSQFKTHDVTVPNMVSQDKKTYSTRGKIKPARKLKSTSARIQSSNGPAVAL